MKQLPLFGVPGESVLGMTEDGFADHVQHCLREASAEGATEPVGNVRTYTLSQLIDLSSRLGIPFSSLVPVPSNGELVAQYGPEARHRGVFMTKTVVGHDDAIESSIAPMREQVKIMLQFDALEAITQPEMPLSQEEQQHLAVFRRRLQERLARFNEDM
ncbi:MAG: hypothetical protein PHW10_05270 [Candidatus Peribacteraceae bacterium]|nr:hypothetical protein [Candidatus Peribacteraceae bacterium]